MKRIVIIIMLALVASGCSLFKITIDSGVKPMPTEQLNTRIMVRGFYHEFSTQIIEAGDSIVTAADSLSIKVNAMRWKIAATSACAAGAFQSVPDVSLLNVWVLCEQMKNLFNNPKYRFFGRLTPVATETADNLSEQINRLARKIMPSGKYQQMSVFVVGYAASHPLSDLTFPAENLTLKWVDYIGESDSTYVKTVGSINEAIADAGDKVSGYGSQYANELRWSKDMVVMQVAGDTTQAAISARVDMLMADFDRIVALMENSPAMVDSLAASLNYQLNQLITTMDGSVNNAFYNFSRERTALQEFIDAQRQLIMAETQKTVDGAVEKAMKELPAMLGKVIFYVVLAMLVLFSLPFVLGYLLGRARERRAQRKKE